MRRRHLVQLAAAAFAAASLGAQAQSSFPAKPIKLVIAFPAGGPTDITMRQLADNAGKVLGQPVIIENKPGAGGTLPAQLLQTSSADGYTLAQIPLGVFRLPYTTKISWDPVKDISYVINVTGYAFGIVVPTDSPFKNWGDFVSYAKANPGKLRVLNTWGEKRLAKFPDAPTLKELGYDIVQNSPFGIGAPRDTPPEVVKKLHEAFKKAMEDPSYVAALARYDMLPIYMDPVQYTRFAQDTFKSEKALVEKLGLAKPS